MSKQFVGSVYSPVPAQFLPGGLTQSEAVSLNLDYAQDLAKARQLMIEAGYPDGFTLDLVTSEKRLYRTYYEVMQRQLSSIGIDCRITVETHSNMHKLIRRTLTPIVIYVAWRPNADAYLSRFFHSDAIVVSGAKPDTNFSHYDKVDQLIEAARLEIDPQRQTQLWVQAQIRILDDMAAFPIMFTKQCYARRTSVDYGHPLVSTMALYPQFTEKTRMKLNR
jgi:peptide/nickel transport system substrate-binding protein